MRELSLAQYAEKYRDSHVPPEGRCTLAESEASDFRLPKRAPDTHKYSYGRALVIAGSRGYTGAPVLAANACERSGAGLTRLLVPACIYPVAALKVDGAVVTPLEEAADGTASAGAIPEVLAYLQTANACVIGPGLGAGEGVRALVRAVVQNAACPLILDADALTVCAGEPALLRQCRAPLILTPHAGEFRRLGGDLTEGRLAGALQFTREYPNLTLILKGCGTLVCRGGDVSVNPTGGPAMAKGGVGDVLCGILCALLAQGFAPDFAARCGVWLHGLAGELCARELGEYSVTPSDLIRRLPQAFMALQGQKPGVPQESNRPGGFKEDSSLRC